ncbi:hypothetical protein PanWU01x14_158390, partial [Parasponia andersonii]
MCLHSQTMQSIESDESTKANLTTQMYNDITNKKSFDINQQTHSEILGEKTSDCQQNDAKEDGTSK